MTVFATLYCESLRERFVTADEWKKRNLWTFDITAFDITVKSNENMKTKFLYEMLILYEFRL